MKRIAGDGIFVLAVLACWVAIVAILVALFPGLCSAIELPAECKIANRGPLCLPASVESLARLHGVEALYGYRDDEHAKILRGTRKPAYDSVVKAELEKRGVNYRMTRAGSFDTSLLDKYANDYGAVVALKAGSGWSSMCHAITVTVWQPDHLEFYCSDKRESGGVKGTWRASRAWFRSAWLGNSLIILPTSMSDALAPAPAGTNDDFSTIPAGASQ